MQIFSKISLIHAKITELKQKGYTIGFVPTMGALHNGHISLINNSKSQTDYTVCSIFVNPTQFNNQSDLKLYPRTPDEDIKLLENAGCDFLYMPDIDDVYSNNEPIAFDFGYLDKILEGEKRQGHFNGVAQVVSILLKGIAPNKAYFGSKDYQQVMIVNSLVKQLNLDIEIVNCPILREEDGLAMSSRNVRLSLDNRATAALIPKLMQDAKLIALTQGVESAKSFVMRTILNEPSMKLDYYEICDADTLQKTHHIENNKKTISLIAVFVGDVRLIDNLMLN